MASAPRPLHSADPKAAYLAAKDDIDGAIRRVLESGRYILGPEVEAFEREFAGYLGAAGCAAVAAGAQDGTCTAVAAGAQDGTCTAVAAGAQDLTCAAVAAGAQDLTCAAVANGTDALELALRAVGVGARDRVATVANTVSATAAAIVACGAVPVFVEIDPATMLMDPVALQRVLAATPGLKAIVPVHLYGLPCDLERITAIARGAGLPVVEDCAQAHGAAIGDRKVGIWGDLAAFSFYPTKNLAALGDGGAVVGRDSTLVGKVRLLRQYGWRTRYVSDGPGRNSRLDEIQAAILRVQLGRLGATNEHRAKLAERYRTGLAGRSSLQLPAAPPGVTHAWHQFVVRTARRDALKAHLEKAGIHCGVLYPVPLHRQAAFASEVSLPYTEAACAEVLSLPLHPGITEADVDRVCAAVKAET